MYAKPPKMGCKYEGLFRFILFKYKNYFLQIIERTLYLLDTFSANMGIYFISLTAVMP